VTAPSPDPAGLPLDELRRLRAELQLEDDAVSYARRVAQARLDLVGTAQARRDRPHDSEWRGDLEAVLSQHLTGGASRPPRPADDLSGSDVAIELEAICSAHGFSRLDDLDGPALDELGRALEDYEQRISSDRRSRFERIDALTAELVRRYRDGEATVDTLLAD
jgi:RsiG-like